MIADVDILLRVCGIGSYLHIGCNQSSLVFELLKKSIDAYGMDESAEVIANHLKIAPNHFIQGTLFKYPFKPKTFDTIVIGEEILNCTSEELALLLLSILLMTKSNLVFYFPQGITSPAAISSNRSNRMFWEQIAISAGFRRHRRSLLAASYEALENEQIDKFIFLECIPDIARQHFSFEKLQTQRDLRMDMLREIGRHADGHLFRYMLAASRIAPGDVVLDAGCGLGYGTAMLAACSDGANFIGIDLDPNSIDYAKENYGALDSALTFKNADILQLNFIPDHSVDTVIAFEILARLPDYKTFFAEVQRVLKPNGRFIASVPNMWSDVNGKASNPAHVHVFDWNTLQEAAGNYFITEGRWSQNAGDGVTRKREAYRLPLDYANTIDAEWWIISARANPTLNQVPYSTTWGETNFSAIPTHIDFAKYYDNPWLYNILVQMNERISDPQMLIQFCGVTIQNSRAGSADQGSALCVLAYHLLESHPITLEAVLTLAQNINIFDAAYDRNNPHCYRWAISLHYVGGRLLLAIGNRTDALQMFLACAEMDVLRFSPLLATKTISARWYAGLILAGNHQLLEAQKQFELGIKEAHRVLQGDWKNIVGSFEDPLLFSLPQAAELLQIANQCAQALHAIKRCESEPGYFWDRLNFKYFESAVWNKKLGREKIESEKMIEEHVVLM